VATTVVHLDYFGIRVRVSGASTDLAEVAFHAGPHALAVAAQPPHLDIAIGDAAGCSREAIVRRGELVVSRRRFRGWTNVPAPIPPFAVLADRLGLLQATVLARGGSVLAVVGSALSAKGAISVALARRGWAFVSGQLLVLDRRSGHVLPYLAPIELRETAARELATSGLADGTWRRVPSRISADVLFVRPESLGRIVAPTARLGRPQLVRLCRSPDERLHLTRSDHPPQLWPATAAPLLSTAPSYRLDLPADEVADEAAELICSSLAPHPPGSDGAAQEQPCLDAPRTARDPRAGLTV
jgi:hypothetical protein